MYRIGTDMYYQATQRQQIEVDYANEVSADNAHYQYQISHGADPGTESANLQSAFSDLAVERDNRLGALYTQTDEVRANHPAFNIQVDGPYQVIGVNYHSNANIQVWDNYTAYAPWPGYVSVGPNPYGWNYGVSYTPGLFVGAYHGWYGGWVGFGSPAFVGFYGSRGPVVVAGLSVNVGMGFGVGIGFGGFFANASLGGYYHSGPGYFSHDPFRGGYISNGRDPRYAMAGRAGYAAGAAAVRSARAAGYANGIRAGSRSSFANGFAPGAAASARAGGSSPYSRPATRAGANQAGGGYGHSAVGAATRGGAGASNRGNGPPPSRGGSGGSAQSSARSKSNGRSQGGDKGHGGGGDKGNRGGGGHGGGDDHRGGGDQKDHKG